MNEILRIYDPNDVGPDGYPVQWHLTHFVNGDRVPAVKDYVRELAGHRCLRCGHPYPPGIAKEYPRGEWTPCDEYCSHPGPFQTIAPDGIPSTLHVANANEAMTLKLRGWHLQAGWRILTVHHLNGTKWDCRWWNLVALCQACHLSIQGRVKMEQIYPFEHSDWFKPYAAGYYAWAYLGQEIPREEAVERMDELLALERQA